MAIIPSQGGSSGTWGTELNAWLAVEHDSGGKHNLIVSWENDTLFWEGDVLTWQT